MAYRSHPESRTARTNSRTAALPSPLNNDLATSTEKDTQCVHFCGSFSLNMAVETLILSEIWQLDRWFLSGIWQLKVIFYPKYGSLLEKVITFEANIKAYVR